MHHVIVARGRQDAQCAPGEQQEDGCRGSQAEGQREEGGGAGDEGVEGFGEQGDGRVEKVGGPKKLFVVAWKWGVKHFRH